MRNKKLARVREVPAAWYGEGAMSIQIEIYDYDTKEWDLSYGFIEKEIPTDTVTENTTPVISASIFYRLRDLYNLGYHIQFKN